MLARTRVKPVLAKLQRCGSRTYASEASPLSRLKSQDLVKTKAYVNGEWISGASNKTFSVDDPATGKALVDVADLGTDETESAISAAYNALPELRKMTGRERGNLLKAWHKQIVDNAADLAVIITAENGKALTDAKGEVAYANAFFEWFAEEAPRMNGQTLLPSAGGKRVYTMRQPVGVAGLITPWNFPAAMLTRKIGPAIAAGCTVVCKLPSETPLTALALAELADRAGLPPGTINCITSSSGNTPTIGKYMCESPTVRKISLTGSTGVGKLLMSQSSSTLKKLSMELGGNAPFIVFDDANVKAAVQGAIASKFRQSGTTCICANRIFVQRGVYDEFVAGLAEAVSKFKVGNGFDEGTTHGPLIHDKAVKKVKQHVADAVDHGAEVVLGGEALSSLGSNFYAPTVLKNVNTDMMLTHEETFGPVAGILPFDTEEEVIKISNAESVGLAGYFYSQDINRCYRVAEALEVGMLGVNIGLISDAAVPFGGVKESGFGREGSSLGIDEYTVWKSVTVGGF